MTLSPYSTLGDDWEVKEGPVLVSPDIPDHPEQMLVFADQMKDGSIRADVTLLKSLKGGLVGSLEKEGKEACLVFRYQAEQSYYYAGLGAWRTKFYIAKVSAGPVYQYLAIAGRQETLKYGTTYRLRIDCFGNQITLHENSVRQLVVFDESYQTGQWGLRSYRTQAQFANPEITLSQPRCFVVMPFASELDFVYQVIKETVEAFGLVCIRADELMDSRPVVDDLKTLIAQADLVIVDFTGKNPNVYYEAGLADAWKKKWIVLSQSSDDLTFDVRHIRTILYSNKMGADVKLRVHLGQAIRETMGMQSLAAR